MCSFAYTCEVNVDGSTRSCRCLDGYQGSHCDRSFTLIISLSLSPSVSLSLSVCLSLSLSVFSLSISAKFTDLVIFYNLCTKRGKCKFKHDTS